MNWNPELHKKLALVTTTYYTVTYHGPIYSSQRKKFHSR